MTTDNRFCADCGDIALYECERCQAGLCDRHVSDSGLYLACLQEGAYPTDAELNATLATHVFGWHSVRYLVDKGVYVDTPQPGPTSFRRG